MNCSKSLASFYWLQNVTSICHYLFLARFHSQSPLNSYRFYFQFSLFGFFFLFFSILSFFFRFQRRKFSIVTLNFLLIFFSTLVNKSLLLFFIELFIFFLFHLKIKFVSLFVRFWFSFYSFFFLYFLRTKYARRKFYIFFNFPVITFCISLFMHTIFFSSYFQFAWCEVLSLKKIKRKFKTEMHSLTMCHVFILIINVLINTWKLLLILIWRYTGICIVCKKITHNAC